MNTNSGQVAGILEELLFVDKNPVLVKCLAVHNEQDWVEMNLANCYDEFDIIRVIEGAVVGRPNSTSDGHSTDNTLELIRNFPDPQNKIELITQDRFFKSLEEQKQTFLELSRDGEWLFIVDCDEFYMSGDVSKIREAIKKRPSATEFIPVFLHFYRDFSHIKAPEPEWQMQHQRIIRYRKGLKYHTHPVATDNEGRCTYFDGSYQLKRFTLSDIFIYHYGHAKGKEFHKMKQAFYKSELEKFQLADGTNASDKFDDKFLEFVNCTENFSTILHYDGPHPKEIADSGLHLLVDPHYENSIEEKMNYQSEPKFKNWREHFVYAADKLPTIALLMMGPWKKNPAVYNEIKI